MKDEKNLKDLIKDIHGLFDSSTSHVPSEQNLDSLCDNFKKSIRKAFKQDRVKKPEGELEDVLYMSSLGTPPRKLWYMARDKNPKSKRSRPEGLLNFLYGDLVESLLVFLVKEAGYKVESEQERVEIDGVGGKLDLIIEGTPVDVKSTNERNFDKFSTGSILEEGNDEFGYRAQISGYAEAKGKDKAGLLAFNKSNGELAYLELNKLDLIDVKPVIKDLRTKISSNTKPKRCYEPEPDGKSGNLKLCKSCYFCPYKKDCWSDANNGAGLRAFKYAEGIRYLTTVIRVPDVEEIKL